MIVNATKNDFINHWYVNYDEFMQIKRDLEGWQLLMNVMQA